MYRVHENEENSHLTITSTDVIFTGYHQDKCNTLNQYMLIYQDDKCPHNYIQRNKTEYDVVVNKTITSTYFTFQSLLIPGMGWFVRVKS